MHFPLNHYKLERTIVNDAICNQTENNHFLIIAHKQENQIELTEVRKASQLATDYSTRWVKDLLFLQTLNLIRLVRIPLEFKTGAMNMD
jgi:hypothetical protein